MKKMITVIFDEDGKHMMLDEENKMCQICNATIQPTDKNCRNCNEPRR
jgi:hypothetical protein